MQSYITTTTPRKPLDEYQQRALATRKRRAPAAKGARLALKAAIERSKAIGTAARQEAIAAYVAVTPAVEVQRAVDSLDRIIAITERMNAQVAERINARNEAI